ncbi:MAG: ABC-ATPase domain-containing protein [Coriobacteriales bacterium]|jgi:predicted ABC-class ATPase
MGADGLRRAIVELDRRGYPAYKPLRGGYDFGDFTLSIDHVQGDPFAAPSKLSAFVAADVAGFPREWVDDPYLRRALEDCLVRRLSGELARRSFRARGSGKSGLLATSRPGPEVIERTACQVVPEGVIARFEAGFPAAGRSILADELVEMLLDLVPRAVRASLMADALPAGMARRAVELADDQRFVRGELERRGLVCFVADGSVLPRESGVSSRPMRDALPFRSPDSLRVTLDLPHRGQTAGMGVPRGVTLIVGGGYHGKTTLLKAIEAGVYDHVAGDGRELVLTDATACKLRAEDGRLVSDVDVSPFIGELPDGTDTHHFSTLDASGSTSQAASLMEDVQAGARALLVDEDTCAANFMVRDALMQRVVSADHEPITPFVERVRELWERRGVSTVIVAGSSGAFFFVADTVIQMDSYRALDITERVRRACAEAEGDRPRQAPAEGSALSGSDEPGRDRVVEAAGASRGRQRRGGARGRGGQGRPSDGAGADEGRVKVRSSGLDEIEVGQARADLRLVEQLVDPEQLDALAQMVRWAAARGLLSGTPVDRVVDEVMEQVGGDGLASVADSCPACGLAMPRTQEVYACLNRLRG